MDGLIEQKSMLVHSKISDASKRNGLINTRNFMAESRDGLVSVYPAPQYQSCRVGGSAAPATLDGSRNEPVQQLLDPNTLQQSVESRYRPNIILYSEGVLRSWGDGVAADCCETTFIEDRSPTKESLEYPEGKFIDLSADDIKIHTLSYDVEEEEEFQELESDYSSDTESEDNFLMMPPRDHLGLSVFSMLCCFWPLGIAAFYLSHEGKIHPELTSVANLLFFSSPKPQCMVAYPSCKFFYVSCRHNMATDRWVVWFLHWEVNPGRQSGESAEL
uniref:Synapse differentiation-inducing gene protein 1 n=1 Tax=Equus caballus TaxID=9796 RepID=A0A9L0SI50_HORSE